MHVIAGTQRAKNLAAVMHEGTEKIKQKEQKSGPFSVNLAKNHEQLFFWVLYSIKELMFLWSYFLFVCLFPPIYPNKVIQE